MSGLVLLIDKKGGEPFCALFADARQCLAQRLDSART
jgi:hypothetical protein